ncbi:MAG TPA: FtsQ-type POTRA domain-containing protein [Acidimicrobiales bacterium]|nr:FtsQ-type POTRA domain-containing protein [Acidimicrobiales bacterium]
MRRARSAKVEHVTDPRIHERRVRVAREKGRRRRRWLLAGLTALAAGGGALALVHSSLLGARHVEISGQPHAPYATVVRVAGLEGAPPLVDLSAQVIAARVESLPWVKTARVSLSWPSTVRIAVTDRTPVAAIPLPGGGYAVADATGRVLEDTAARPLTLPLVMAGGAVPAPGGRLDGPSAELARVAALTPEAMVAEISSIAWGSGGIVVRLAGGRTAVLGDDSALGDKFVALYTVLEKANLSGIVTIDLRVPSAPVLIR